MALLSESLKKIKKKVHLCFNQFLCVRKDPAQVDNTNADLVKQREQETDSSAFHSDRWVAARRTHIIETSD